MSPVESSSGQTLAEAAQRPADEEVRDLVAELRTPRVSHHAVNREWEDYATVARTHAIEPIKLRAAAMLEALAETQRSSHPSEPDDQGAKA